MTDRSTPVTAASSFDALQFSTVFPGRALPRLVRRIENRGVQVVYDLEDIHWIPTDAALTTELKRRSSQMMTDRRHDRASPSAPSAAKPFAVSFRG